MLAWRNLQLHRRLPRLTPRERGRLSTGSVLVARQEMYPLLEGAGVDVEGDEVAVEDGDVLACQEVRI